MVTEASLAMKAVVSELQPGLKVAGFRKRAHTFNRTIDAGLIHVINFQMGPFDPPGTVELPDLRPNLYGQFAINLGVFIEEAWRLDTGRFGPAGAPASKTWVNEYDCQLRRRIDNPDSATGWWPLDDTSIRAQLVGLMHQHVFAWFDRYRDRPAILSALESAPTNSYEISGEGPDRLLATRMRLGAGNTHRAQELFNDWVRYCREKAEHEPHTRGHLDYLAKYAQQVNLSMPTPD